MIMILIMTAILITEAGPDIILEKAITIKKKRPKPCRLPAGLYLYAGQERG